MSLQNGPVRNLLIEEPTKPLQIGAKKATSGFEPLYEALQASA